MFDVREYTCPEIDGEVWVERGEEVMSDWGAKGSKGVKTVYLLFPL